MIRQETRNKIAEQAAHKTRHELARMAGCHVATVDAILTEKGQRAKPDKRGPRKNDRR